MSKSKWVRTLPGLCIGGVLAILLWQFSGNARQRANQDPPTASNSIAIKITQLPLAEGVIPVEVTCQTQGYLKPTKGKALRCILKNNFSSPVTAVSLAYTVKYEANGKKSSDSGFMTMDALVHRDFRESNFSKFIHPGTESDIQSQRLIEESMSDIEIIVGIDYVEFDNGKALGPDSGGSRLVMQIRAGAAKYKEWLKQNYVVRGKSMAVVKSLLEQTTSVATDLGIPSELEVGAMEYRRNARQVINFRGGPSELEKHLVVDGPGVRKP